MGKNGGGIEQMGHLRWVEQMDSSAERSASKAALGSCPDLRNRFPAPRKLAAMTDGSGRTMQRISSAFGDSCQSILDPLLRPMRLAIAAGMVIWFFPVTVVIMD